MSREAVLSPAWADPWRAFARTFVLAALTVATGLYGLVVALDPYGIFVSGTTSPGPLMDLNQRYMYPQIVRSGRFDAAIFGTSTIRLLDPRALGDLVGGRFANLAMNAATPWEQLQIAGLFLRLTPRPTMLVFGIDMSWCEADANRKRLTARPFPPWLYDDDRRNDWPGLFNLTSVEIAFRAVGWRLGLMRERIAPDGFEVFTPAEKDYDLERARAHLWGQGPRAMAAIVPAEETSQAERDAWRFPALAWLDDVLEKVPRKTKVVLLFPPAHWAGQPVPGSKGEAWEAECKRQVAGLASRHGAAAVDFRRLNPVTAEDGNFWDRLHYRLPIAARLAQSIQHIVRGTSPDDDGFYRVLTRTSKREGPP